MFSWIECFLIGVAATLVICWAIGITLRIEALEKRKEKSNQ